MGGYYPELTKGIKRILRAKLQSYFYRFKEDSNPSDAAMLYATSSDGHQLKGVLVNAYGIYSELLTDEMLQKLRLRK